MGGGGGASLMSMKCYLGASFMWVKLSLGELSLGQAVRNSMWMHLYIGKAGFLEYQCCL